jgi:hypothetical protein
MTGILEHISDYYMYDPVMYRSFQITHIEVNSFLGKDHTHFIDICSTVYYFILSLIQLNLILKPHFTELYTIQMLVH